MQSVMKHMFSQVPKAEIPRSMFDRSHGFKTTLDAGWLIPVYVDEAVPGDTFKLNMTQFARMGTPLVPIMDNLRCDSFFFAVPKRLVWDNFKKQMGEQIDPGSSTDYLTPQMTSYATTGYAPGDVFDYMGLPTGIPGLVHSCLPLRAYNLIWNEWFRDQNLQSSLAVAKTDGPDLPSVYTIQKRGKRHDYFTSALPWPQKGTAVALPLGTSAPIIGIGKVTGNFPSVGLTNMRESTGSMRTYPYAAPFDPGATDGGWYAEGLVTGYPNIRADLSTATAATVNALRQAIQIQKLYERDARGGTRYTEIVRSHFGVISPDARLQRPEYLGGGSTPITIKAIEQTGASVAGNALGKQAATGVFTSSGAGFTKSFTEHSIIIGLISIRADLNYQQGLNRMWSRRTRWDYYWPALAHIGEQAILNKEIYAQGAANLVADEAVFGYQERYAEYRYKPSLITGLFRSQAAGALDVWHLAQEFGSLPALNAAFIKDDPPIDRVIAVPSEPQFLYDAYFNLICARPIPVNGVPGQLDRF